MRKAMLFLVIGVVVFIIGLLMAVYGGIQVHRYRKAEKENIS